MFSLTAAHPTLPFGSMVRLVNVKNGRSQVVRINDRGPYVEGREIDVSFLVASRLGLLDKGVDRVRIELLGEPQPQHQP
jgi:rare lipoprotein A